MKHVLIGGIGNVLLGDDGVGPYVARLLEACYEFEPGVEIEDLGTPALDLIDRISGMDAVILIDSVASEGPAGTVTLYRKADILRHSPAARMDPHSPALVDTLLSADLFGVAPPEVLLVGIKPAAYDVGCNLSPVVKAKLDVLVAAVLVELDRLGVGYTVREQRGEHGMWWNREDQQLAAGS
jgi:hydrogenase maturation protease